MEKHRDERPAGGSRLEKKPKKRSRLTRQQKVLIAVAAVLAVVLAGVLLGLEMTVEEMTAMGNPVHRATLEARDFLKGQINSGET